MIRLIATFLFALASPALAEPIPVWLDVDTSTGVEKEGRQADVDDGLAMIYALNSPELDVRGVSVQFGNATLEQAMPVARDVLRDFAPARYADLEAHAGAASADDLGRETDATRALVAELEKTDEPITILPLGPVTNVATVVRDRPDLHGKIAKIVVVAARREGFVFGPPQAGGYRFPDANFEKDVAGMQILLDSGLPIVFAGYEVSSHVWLSGADLDALAQGGTPAGRWVSDTSRAWLTQWTENLKTPGFNPFDTLALAYLTHPEMIEGFPARLSISERIDERAKPEEQAAGKTKAYLDAVEDESSPHLYLVRPAPEFHAVVVERLAGPAPAATRPAN